MPVICRQIMIGRRSALMFNKISNISFKNGSGLQNKSAKKENKTVSIPVHNSRSIPKFSQEHLHANFAINFGASKPPKAPKAAPDDTEELKPPSLKGVIKTVSAKAVDNSPSAIHYDETANKIAIALGDKKNVLLVQEEDADEKTLAQRFVQNLQSGQHKRIGFDSNTSVHIVDAEDLTKKQATISYMAKKMLDKNPAGKHVVFLKNIAEAMALLNATGQNPGEYLSKPLLTKVHIVGLMSQKEYSDSMNPESQIGVPAEDLRPMVKIDFDGLSPEATKKALKEDTTLTAKVLRKHKGQNLVISPKAIDEIVNKSSTLEGAFPAKALKVLGLVASAKLNSAPNGEAKKPSRDNKITSADVKRFFKEHSDLLTALKPQKGQFTLAENVTTKLKDVGGIKPIIENIQEGILAYIKDPKAYTAKGQSAPKGVLLHSDPGTGKTLLARAIAGEANVPFIAASASEFEEKFVGVGAQRVRELFAAAHKAAAASEKKTAIIFIDEIDAIGKKRSGDNKSGADSSQTLNQLLAEMDGFNNKESKTKVIVIAATNRLDVLDSALTRPGRFDDKLEVPSAAHDEEARREILEIHAKKKPFASDAERKKILDAAAKITEGMSGADIAGVMAKAAKSAGKRPNNPNITHNDVVEGYLQAVAGPITKNAGKSEALKALIVRHECGHAILIDTLRALPNYKEKISFITLDPRGEFLGSVFFHNSEKSLSNFESVVASAAASYAGGLAEPGYKKEGHGAGVSADLRHATGIITKAIKEWGLGINTPQITIDKDNELAGIYKKEIKKDVAIYSTAASKIAKLVIDFHQSFLDKYVDTYKANAGKGGNNLSGEEFSKMREQWLQETGKDKQLPVLMKTIRHIIHEARKGNITTELVVKMPQRTLKNPVVKQLGKTLARA